MKRVWAVGLLGLLVACSAGTSGPAATGARSPASAPGLVVTPNPVPTHRVAFPKLPRNSLMPKPGGRLVDGEYFGLLNSVDLDQRTVQVNFAQWLSGRRASRAAYADGYIDSPNESVPNDYYVHDASEQLATVPLASHVLVTLYKCGLKNGCGQVEGTLEGLATALAAPVNKGYGEYRGRLGKYWLKFRLGQVVRIDEIFTP